jgi:hypothetical protein
VADKSNAPFEPEVGELDELLIFGNPEMRRRFIKQVADTSAAIMIGPAFD